MTGKPKRAATTSAKARNAAAIAAAEAQEPAEKPMKKARGHPPKKLKAEAVPVEVEDELEESKDSVDGGVLELVDNTVIDWTPELTWTLISAIEEDEEIRDGLFPGVGAIKLSGGKPKTHYYYSLAVKCFAEHEKYKDIFAVDPEQSPATLAKQRKLWTENIKNKIKPLITKARENIIEMGQTGAGIASADDIKPGTNLATKWDLIKKDSPWFFHVRSLIASRPNLQPVGLGNNDSAFDVDLLLRTPFDDDLSSVPPEDTEDLPSQLTGDVVDAVDISSDSDTQAQAGPGPSLFGRGSELSQGHSSFSFQEMPRLPPSSDDSQADFSGSSSYFGGNLNNFE
ncbi:hypothetical protein B0H13DRAFT_2551810 [Mycena leptocephala]|nr:hypothetical protein B0H13DRAFT_2551810 [Mycena leptocephala]